MEKEPEPVKAKVAEEVDIDEVDDALLELLTAPAEEEPFIEIVETLERHQKPEHVRTTLKKSVDADKPIQPVHKKRRSSCCRCCHGNRTG